MGKITFEYGAMSSGKSREVLKILHTYKSQHKNVLTIKADIDDRNGAGYIGSRDGEKEIVDLVERKSSLDAFQDDLENLLNEFANYDLVLIDEAQFLNRRTVETIVRLTELYNPEVPIIFFGLLKDFTNNMFDTARYIIEYADDIRELKCVCRYCRRKATCNLKIVNGKPNYHVAKNNIEIGGDELYVSTCRYHYYNPQGV